MVILRKDSRLSILHSYCSGVLQARSQHRSGADHVAGLPDINSHFQPFVLWREASRQSYVIFYYRAISTMEPIYRLQYAVTDGTAVKA